MFLLLLIFYDWRSFVGCWRCCPVSASPFHTQFVYIACYICGAMPVSLLQFDNHCEVELSWAATRHGVAIRSYINVCCCCCCLITLYAHHLAILHSCCCCFCCCWRAFNTFLFYAVDSLIYYTHMQNSLICVCCCCLIVVLYTFQVTTHTHSNKISNNNKYKCHNEAIKANETSKRFNKLDVASSSSSSTSLRFFFRSALV